MAVGKELHPAQADWQALARTVDQTCDHFTARSKQAVSSVRRRLYAKIFGKPGRPEDWDEFIGEF